MPHLLTTGVQENKGSLCKPDTEKAYNHVNWSFLHYMLMRMGFCVKWNRWIKSCITSISFTIMVNRRPSFFFFKTFRSLRQGDQLSLLLLLQL